MNKFTEAIQTLRKDRLAILYYEINRITTLHRQLPSSWTLDKKDQLENLYLTYLKRTDPDVVHLDELQEYAARKKHGTP